MNHGEPIKRDHVVLSFRQLAEILELDGRITHIWREDDNDYLHIHLLGAGKEYEDTGHYVEARHFIHGFNGANV